MPFIKRLNTHQLHLEQLVLLGPDGLEELNDKIEGTIDTLENESGRLNLTTKIDGAPAMICWSSYPGYPDNSIALKGFISGPQNAISSPDQVDAKYGDRPGMSQMLKYGLELAKHIPAGEAWQGDCLFVSDTKREEEINGKDYITFQPNKIIYAFSEDNPGYEKVKNADFGIAFHTIYTGEDKKQSFKVDASKLNVPSNIYIMSPSLNKPTDKKVFNLDKVKSQFDKLENLEQKLLSNFDYEDLVNNRVFMNYWNTFENANLADKKAVTINENTFINDLKEYIKSKRTKEYETQVGKLKTDAGKEKAKTKYEQDLVDLQELVDTNKELLTTLVQTLNCAATIKMLLWQGFKQTQFDYTTFYRSRTKGYIPGEMEGVAMSDQDGNIVKIVDRSTFSSYNRDPDIISGFEHPENLTEEQQCFIEEYNNELTECGSKQLWERFGRLLESDQKTAVVAFGRMNPPTIGHQKLVDKMASLAQGEKAKLFLSHTQDKKKNPLSYEQKIRYAKEAFEPKIDVVESEDKTIIDVLYNLYNQGYTDIIYVGGEDRIGGSEDISSLIMKYNGQPTKDGRIVYDFNSIQFKSAGGGDENGDREKFTYDYVKQNLNKLNLEEIASASLVRECVKQGDFELFKKLVPFEDSEAEEMFNKVRVGLGILNEDVLSEKVNEIGNVHISYTQDGEQKEVTVPVKQSDSSSANKNSFDVPLGLLHYYKNWKGVDTVDVKLSTGDLNGEDHNAKVGVYHSNRVKFNCTIDGRKITLNGTQGLQSKGFSSEDKSVHDDTMRNTIIDGIMKDYLSSHPGVKMEYVEGSAETLNQNPSRQVNYKELFEIKDLYKPGDEKFGEIIADTKFTFLIDGKKKTFYVSNKYGPVHTPINAGITKVDSAEELLEPVCNISSLSAAEKNLLNIWWSTKSTRNIVEAIDKKTKEAYLSWYYVITGGIKTDNLINYLANQYASGYYYVHETYKGDVTVENIDNIVKNMKESTVNSAFITITQSMVAVNVSVKTGTGNTINTEIDFRRKGSTNYNLLSKRTTNVDIKRKGKQLEDLDKYDFAVIATEEY